MTDKIPEWAMEKAEKTLRGLPAHMRPVMVYVARALVTERRKTLERAMQAIEAEKLTDNTGAADDIAYNAAIDHAQAAIRALSDDPI